jgi:uncharacterized protein with FMN-binding domain
MKKYTIGFAVGIVFLVYSFGIRNQHSAPVVAPASLKQSGSSSSPSSSTANASSNSQASTNKTLSYKDGTYNGSVGNAYYGNVQVAAVISGGKLTDVKLLQTVTEDPNSIYINQAADPYLKQEALKSQSANISIITGATLTSDAYIQSLNAALRKAKN